MCCEYTLPAADVVQEMPVLPSWLANDPTSVACAKTFVANGGYGEMTVVGESDECDHVDKPFNYVTYCPLSCNDNPTAPECINCKPGGGGNF